VVNCPECRIHPGDTVVEIDPRYFRPTEVDTLLGDASKAERLLGWRSRTPFEQLVKEMVSEDIKTARRDLLCASRGYRIRNYE
jgi:GDPmannose 4,6-dehydratase